MKRDIAHRWVAALRSGKFRQGRRQLRRNFGDGQNEFCCLGVLCELAVADGVIPPYDNPACGYRSYDGAINLTPSAVMEWAGLTRSNGFYPSRSGEWTQPPLSIQNDNGKSFVEIADIIEANIDRL